MAAECIQPCQSVRLVWGDPVGSQYVQPAVLPVPLLQGEQRPPAPMLDSFMFFFSMLHGMCGMHGLHLKYPLCFCNVGGILRMIE